ncbi:hypothetical protein, partial [Thermus scotoductus]
MRNRVRQMHQQVQEVMAQAGQLEQVNEGNIGSVRGGVDTYVREVTRASGQQEPQDGREEVAG